MGKRRGAKKIRGRRVNLYSIGEIGAAVPENDADVLSAAPVPPTDSWGRPARLSTATNQAVRLPQSGLTMETQESSSTPFVASSHGSHHLLASTQPSVHPAFGKTNRGYYNQPEETYAPSFPGRRLPERAIGTTAFGVGNGSRPEEVYRTNLGSHHLLERSNGSANNVGNPHSFAMASSQPPLTTVPVPHYESENSNLGSGIYMGNNQEQQNQAYSSFKGSSLSAQPFVSYPVANPGVAPRAELYGSHPATNGSFLHTRNKERRAPQKLTDWARPSIPNHVIPNHNVPSGFAPIWGYDVLRDSSPRDVQQHEGNF